MVDSAFLRLFERKDPDGLVACWTAVKRHLAAGLLRTGQSGDASRSFQLSTEQRDTLEANEEFELLKRLERSFAAAGAEVSTHSRQGRLQTSSYWALHPASGLGTTACGCVCLKVPL